MARVWIAVAAVAVVLAAVVGVVAVRGFEPIPGTAVAGPPPGPPAAGDCLLKNPWLVDPDYSAEAPLAALRTAPCDGKRVGEVVSVGAPTNQYAMFDDGTFDQCWNAIETYLGVPPPTGGAVDRYEVTNASPTLIGPDAGQLLAGQKWSACVLGVPPVDEVGTPGTVSRSLRGAWHRPDDSRLSALCLDDPTSFVPVSCFVPHGIEQVTYWQGVPGRDADDEQADCRSDVADALGSSDALDSQELIASVVLTAYDDDGDPITGPAAAESEDGFYANCVVAPADPDRQLTASVRGLGDDPVPLG